MPTSPEALELPHSHSHCVSEQVSFRERNVVVASFVEVCAWRMTLGFVISGALFGFVFCDFCEFGWNVAVPMRVLAGVCKRNLR